MDASQAQGWGMGLESGVMMVAKAVPSLKLLKTTELYALHGPPVWPVHSLSIKLCFLRHPAIFNQ